MTSLQLNPLGEQLGADIAGVNLNALTEHQFEDLYQHWLTWGVLRIRGQRLTDAQLQQFSSRFGPLEEAPLGLMPEAQRRKLKNRFVTVISNIEVDGKPIGGLSNKEATWHSDMTYIESPPPASVLMSIEVPAVGGDTHFCDQVAAYATLPTHLRDKIQAISIKHNAAHTSIGSLRPGFEPITDPTQAPGAIHPAVRIHEETGSTALYLGRRELAYIPGVSLRASEQLLDEIWEYAALPQNTWTQQWQVGDVVIWDNRRVMHRREGFDAGLRRLMKRCQVLARDTNDSHRSSVNH
jgi:taurine dioxygenase